MIGEKILSECDLVPGASVSTEDTTLILATKPLHLYLQRSTLDLPNQLRKLEQMRCERRQWALEHYAVTEQGLLDRFGPGASLKKRQQEDEVSESCQAASTKPAASEKVCPAPASAHQPVSPQSVAADSSVNIAALPDPVDQTSKPTMAARRDLRPAARSGSPGGPTKMPLQLLAQGKLCGQQQPPAPLRSAGRGFLLHMSQSQVSHYSSSA